MKTSGLKIRRHWLIIWLLICICGFCTGTGCKKTAKPTEVEPEKKKKLKLKFRPDLKEKWRKMEAEEKARRKKDVVEVRKLHAVLPDSPDPAEGIFTLKNALSGIEGEGKLTAVIDTDKGSLFCELFEEEEPFLVANFAGLARGARPWWDNVERKWVKKPFYDGLPVFAVYSDSIIRTGCPLGDGTGGPGYVITQGMNESMKHDVPGRLSMVFRSTLRPGVGSQFNITAAPLEKLDKKDIVIGQCEPLSVIRELAAVKIDQKNHRPVESLDIISIRIKRKDD